MKKLPERLRAKRRESARQNTLRKSPDMCGRAYCYRKRWQGLFGCRKHTLAIRESMRRMRKRNKK